MICPFNVAVRVTQNSLYKIIVFFSTTINSFRIGYFSNSYFNVHPLHSHRYKAVFISRIGFDCHLLSAHKILGYNIIVESINQPLSAVGQIGIHVCCIMGVCNGTQKRIKCGRSGPVNGKRGPTMVAGRHAVVVQPALKINADRRWIKQSIIHSDRGKRWLIRIYFKHHNKTVTCIEIIFYKNRK